MPFEWIAAIRFLKEGRMQTSFIIVGVSIGVAVIVFMSAMLAGLQANFIKRVLTSQSHISLIPRQEVARPLRYGKGVIEAAIVQVPTQRIRSVDQWQKIRLQLRAMDDVVSVSPVMSGSALAVRGAASRAITAIGIEPESYFDIVRLPDNIVAGQPRLTSDDIVIGIELAKDLGVSVGDKVVVAAANGRSNTLTITGLVDLGNKGVNQRNTYVALRTAQTLLDLVGGVTSLEVTVQDVYAAERVAQRIEAANDVEADSWIRTNVQFFTAVNAQQISNTAIRVFVGLSVALGIASVLIVSVVQRSREIGILRAMGSSRGQILRVFLIQGGLVGFVGAMIGSALGAGALVFWHSWLRQADGSELFPLILETRLFVQAALVATVVGVAAAMTPALRASHLDPVVAIRG